MSRNILLFVLIIAPVLCRRGGGGGGGSHHSGGGGHYGGHSPGTHPGYGSPHHYPNTNGLSGHGTGAGSNRPAGASYPSSNGLSGNNRAPGNTYHKTEIHHHHYSPPQQIHYGGGHPYPVYHGPPPTYIYTYRDSGSPYNTLLTGLALYNLGRMSAHSHNHEYREYRQRNGEVCTFEIHKPDGGFQETRFGCELMSHYIWQHEQNQQNKVVSTNTNTVTVTETKTSDNITVTTTNTTKVVDALQVKGPPIEVTSGMSCYVKRTLPGYSTIKEKVECGLLQEYALKTFNNAWHIKPVFALIVLLSSMFHFI